jgi:predicted permease|tara:strand:+ start:237 stop:1154 length:918 start_codon:yes stop_codon:yes gene_type:complete
LLNNLGTAVFPIFAIGAFGFLLGKMRTFDFAAAFSINKFVMFVCMPALCIEFLASAHVESFDFLLLFGYFLSEVILFSLGVFISKYIFRLLNSEALLIGLALALTNHVLFVLPIADELFEEAKTLTIISIITMDGLVIFSLTLIAMDILSNSDRPFSITIKAIFTNPPLIGIVIGLVVSFNNLELPRGIMFFLEKLGGTATPALLFSLGIVLSYQKKIAPTKLIISMSTLKLIIHPILAWLIITLLFGGRYPESHSTALMVAAAPSGVMAYMLAMNYNVSVNRISPIILYTSIGSLITVSIAATM